MSRAGTVLLQEKENITDTLSSQMICGTKWTEPMMASIVREVHFPDRYDIERPEVYNILDIQARAIAESFYKIAQQLSQATVTAICLIHSTSFTHPSHEQDIWVEMPARSVRDIVMNVQNMGRGEPLGFPDEFLEE